MIGHNPQAKPSDALPDVAALLRDLPRVSAPADFNASLQARIAAAKAEANEFADVTALLKELPRVAAPADFDFRLRARIAQAKAKQQETSAGWLADLFGRTFSWTQAAAAMAAVAIVVSFVTFGILRSELNPTNSTTIAQVERPTLNVAPPALIIGPTESLPSIASGSVAGLQANAPRPRTIKYSPRSATPHVAPLEGKETLSDMPATIVATKIMIKHRSGEARMINPSEYNFGLQTANLRPTPRVTPNTGESALTASIY